MTKNNSATKIVSKDNEVKVEKEYDLIIDFTPAHNKQKMEDTVLNMVLGNIQSIKRDLPWYKKFREKLLRWFKR